MKSTKAQSSSAQNKPQAVEEIFARGTPYDKDSRRWKEITAAIATYICKDIRAWPIHRPADLNRPIIAFLKIIGIGSHCSRAQHIGS